jgi:hypothetical protein
MNDLPPVPSGFARLSAAQARATLLGAAILAALAAAVTFSPMSSGNFNPARRGPGDVELYRAEIERIRAGEGYYTAAAAELTARGYPTRSVFNWRMPLPLWLLGALPSDIWGKALLGVLAFALLAMAFECMSRDGSRAAALLCGVLLTGPLLPVALGDLYVLPALWSGVLIGLSVCAYGLERRRLGAVCGLSALFMRELAMPYCLLAIALAWREQRRKELIYWAAGLAAWAVYFGLHWLAVAALRQPDAIAHRHGWVCFGGAGFVISIAQMNAYLLLLPQWVTALYLVAALVGLAGWNSRLGTRVGLAACLYLAAFAAVGQQFNQYWGVMISPLLCFGVARFPASVADLLGAAAARDPSRGKCPSGA